MGNYKIKVASEAESKEAQELFFELGYEFNEDTPQACRNRIGMVAANGGCIYPDRVEFFDKYSGYKEITMSELRAMVKLHKNPIDMNKVVDSVRDEAMKLLTDNDQREYLNKLTDGTYKLVVLAGDFSGVDGLIEVPEGAERARIYNGELRFFSGPYMKVDINDSYFGAVVWQRHTQPGELPFLSSGYDIDSDKINHDFNPSINDQYAEIEQHRAAIKVDTSGNDSDHIADAFGYAAMSIINNNSVGAVESMLADRQSQYGDFKDVANTTQWLMDQFALGRMSNVQREALHMICSKLARIANGDPNHIDSWHDIAGYATLVVNDLES